MRAKPLSFLLIFVLLSSNAYASGMKGLAVFVVGIYIVPFFDTNSFNSFHLKITEDYHCIKFILICLFYHLIFLCRRFYSKSVLLIGNTWTGSLHFCHFQNKKSPGIVKFFISFEKPTRWSKVIAPYKINSHQLAEKVCAFS